MILRPRQNREQYGFQRSFVKWGVGRTAGRQEGAIGGDVFGDPFPKRGIPRLPAQLPPGVLDRDDAAEGRLHLVLGGHLIGDLDAAAGNELLHELGRLGGRDQPTSCRRVEDSVSAWWAIDEACCQRGDVDHVGLVARPPAARLNTNPFATYSRL